MARTVTEAVIAAANEVERYGIPQKEAAAHFGVNQGSVSRELARRRLDLS